MEGLPRLEEEEEEEEEGLNAPLVVTTSNCM